MDHLDAISGEDLRGALDEVDRKKPTQRLLAAIAYKNGVSQTELADWFGVQRRTIYSWLKRLESEPLERAVRDAGRSGRPRKLADEHRARLEEVLHEPPTAVGIDAPTWTPTLVRRYVRDAFGVEYSVPSCRRLMKEAGLRYRKPRRSATATDPEDRDPSRNGSDDVDGGWMPR